MTSIGTRLVSICVLLIVLFGTPVYAQQPGDRLLPHFKNRIDSCALGLARYELLKNSNDLVVVERVLDSPEQAEILIEGFFRSSVDIDLSLISRIHEQRNLGCLAENLRVLKQIFLAKRSDGAFTPDGRADERILTETVEGTLSPPDNNVMSRLRIAIEKNKKEQALLCVMSPVHCFRALDVGDLLAARLDAEEAKKNVDASKAPLMALNAIVRYYFEARYDKLTIVEDRPGYLFFRTGPEQGIILQGHDFWEVLEVKIVISFLDDSVDLTVISDGRFGAGVTAPREATDYVDFEIVFSKEFDEYTRGLASSLHRFLTGAEGAMAARSTIITRKNLTK